MKRCPTCNRTYTEGKFCLEDATPLVADEPSVPDNLQTVAIPVPLEHRDRFETREGVGSQPTPPSEDYQKTPPTVRAGDPFATTPEAQVEALSYDDEATAVAMPKDEVTVVAKPKDAAPSDWSGPSDWSIPPPTPPAASAQSARPARSFRWLFVIAPLALIVIIVGGFLLWWQSYKSTPAYSLALLVDAVQRNDQSDFDQLVDTDKIVENFVPQVTEKALGTYAAALTSAFREQVTSLVPTLMPQVKQVVRDEFTGQVKELAARAEGKPFILIALGMPYEVDIKEDDDKAEATVKLKDRQVVLTMLRNGERWKIVAVKDDAMATRIVEKIASNLPSLDKNNLEKEVRKRLKNLPNIPGVTDGDKSKKQK